MTGWEGKNILVTGASSGIGQTIVIRFGHRHVTMAVNYWLDGKARRKRR